MGIIEPEDSALHSFHVFGGAGNTKSQGNSVSVTSGATSLNPSPQSEVLPGVNPDVTWKSFSGDFQPCLHSFWKSLIAKQYQISIGFGSNVALKSGTAQFPGLGVRVLGAAKLSRL